jgi:hypothetical protein
MVSSVVILNGAKRSEESHGMYVTNDSVRASTIFHEILRRAQDDTLWFQDDMLWLS